MPQIHAVVGGSVSGRILQCPWYLANANLAPIESGTNFAAQEGTALHAVLEAYYQHEIKSFDDVLGKQVEGVTITEEQLERVRDAARALDAYCDQLEEEIGQTCELWFERHVEIPFSDDVATQERLEKHFGGAFGTCDVILKCGYVAAMLDYKFGRQIVYAEENPQLMFYALGARESIPQLAECTHFELSIIQPANDDLISTWKTTPERLSQYHEQLTTACVLAADFREEELDMEAVCNTGAYCQWCPLEAQCPKKAQTAERALLATADELDIDALRYWMDKASEVESFLSAVREKVLALLEAGKPVEGYKLVERRANRVWATNHDVEKWLLEEAGLEPDAYMDTKMKSPAQIEKLLEKGVDLPEEFVTKKSSGHTVAPMADKRKDLNANDFSALRRLSES